SPAVNYSMPPIPASNRTSASRSRGAPPDYQCRPMPRPELSLAQRAALSLLRAYKILISPMFAGSCRFLPSCSDYMAEAVRRFGVLRGTLLGLRRLARCHPLG